WLFARQRYWGEPFPIVYDEDGQAHALPESMLPIELPEVEDYQPVSFDPDDAASEPQPPLAKAKSGLRLNSTWVREPRPTTVTRMSCRSGQVLPSTSCATLTQSMMTRWSILKMSVTGLVHSQMFTARMIQVALTCTSAVWSTPSCTCCTRVSGTRCSLTWDMSLPRSHTVACTTRATSRLMPTRILAESMCQQPR